jgi:hypothetical protein
LELVNLNLSTVDEGFAKVVQWLLADILIASDRGTCTFKLFVVVNGIRRFLHATTQAVEGVNSVIRLVSDRCKNIGLLLLDARVRIKKALGLGSADQSAKWSQKRPKALQLLRDCMVELLSDHAHAVACDNNRFSTASPLLPEQPREGWTTSTVATAHHARDRWSKALALKFHALMKHADVSRLLTFDETLSIGSSAYVVIDKYYATSDTVEVTIACHTPDPEDATQTLVQCVVKRPRRYARALAADPLVCIACRIAHEGVTCARCNPKF